MIRLSNVKKLLASVVAIAAMTVQTSNMAKDTEAVDYNTTVLSSKQDILEYSSNDDRCYYLYQPTAEYEPYICMQKENPYNVELFEPLTIGAKLKATFTDTDLWEIENLEVWTNGE